MLNMRHISANIQAMAISSDVHMMAHVDRPSTTTTGVLSAGMPSSGNIYIVAMQPASFTNFLLTNLAIWLIHFPTVQYLAHHQCSL